MKTRTCAEPKNNASTFAPVPSNHTGQPVPNALLQRKCACGDSAGLTGQCARCDKERLTLQRQAKQPESSLSPSIPPIVHDVLRSPGQPLDGRTRAFMEPRFGHDFSRVRVHTDAQAAESAQAVNALAYTVGHDIVFAAGQYGMETSQGLKLIAHELTHVAQQRRAVGSSADAEHRAQNAAVQVARGGFVGPETIGQGQLGVHADDGKQTVSPDPTSSSFKPSAPPLVGPLKVSSWLIQELIRQGQLSPQMLQLIESGQIEIKPDKERAPTATGAEPSTVSEGGGDFATEFNTLPYRFPGLGVASLGASGFELLTGPKATVASAPATQWVPTGGYFDPVIGYIPRHFVKWTPPTPTASQPAGEPNGLQKSLADLRTSFDFSEGLTISSISNPGVSTSIFITGITQRAKAPGGLDVQTALGWDKSVGLQLSYRDWYLHGTFEVNGKWGLTLSFPNDAPVPVTPWVNDIFHEGGVAIQGIVKAAAAGPPNLNNLDPLIKELTPRFDRMKGVIDAAKGIGKAQPGVNVALTVGSGPRPGATPSDKPSGIFFGGAIVGRF